MIKSINIKDTNRKELLVSKTENGKPFNILLGGNEIGKSTLSKMLNNNKIVVILID